MSPNKIQDMMVVENPEILRLIFSKKHNMILKLVAENELSISDIARTLNVNPGSVHYHLKDLEKHGLVKLVREEVKGGIVKKFYRSTARRILLDSPNFNRMDKLVADDFVKLDERLVESIEYLGYHISPDNTEDARELMKRFNERMKVLFMEIHNSGLESVQDDGMIVGMANQMILIMRAINDPEIDRINSEFKKLFTIYE